MNRDQIEVVKKIIDNTHLEMEMSYDDDLDQRFYTHVLDPEQQNSVNEITLATRALAGLYSKHCPPSRELSKSLTELEDAKMWAAKAISKQAPLV